MYQSDGLRSPCLYRRNSESLEAEISAASISALILPLCLDEIQGRNRQMTSSQSDAEKGRTD